MGSASAASGLQDLGEHRRVDIAARQRQTHGLASDVRLLLQSSCQRCRPCAFGDIVGIAEQ